MSVQPPGNAESSNLYSTLRHAFLAAIKRVDTSLSPTRSIQRIWTPTLSIFHLVIGGSCLTIRPSYTLAILFAIWMIALTIPFTSQFFVPATPMLLYLLTVHSVGLFPVRSLPIIIQPTSNVFDTLPFNFLSFALHILIGASLWLFRKKRGLHFYAQLIGYANLASVLALLVLPYSSCYSDARFIAAMNAGNATLNALSVAHFFPQILHPEIGKYACLICWALVNLAKHNFEFEGVAIGICFALVSFCIFLPEELRGAAALAPPLDLLPSDIDAAANIRSDHHLDGEHHGSSRSTSASRPNSPSLNVAIPRSQTVQPTIDIPIRDAPLTSSIIEYNPQSFADFSFEELADLGQSSTRGSHKVRYRRNGAIYVRKSITPREMSVDQLIRELGTLLVMQHVNLVKCFGIYTSDRDGEEMKLVLEFCEGGSLESVGKMIKDRGGVVGEKVVGRLAEGILQGLAYLHDMPIFHRDIKPPNVLLSREGIVKLSEFVASGESVNALGDTFLSLVPYTAPERLVGNGYTGRADIWSTGITLLEFIQHKHPFPEDLGPLDLIMHITNAEPPGLEEEPGIVWSNDMKNFISQMLSKDPMTRPDARVLLEHPWISLVKKQEYRMEKWMRQVWSWPKASR